MALTVFGFDKARAIDNDELVKYAIFILRHKNINKKSANRHSESIHPKSIFFEVKTILVQNL